MAGKTKITIDQTKNGGGVNEVDLDSSLLLFASDDTDHVSAAIIGDVDVKEITQMVAALTLAIGKNKDDVLTTANVVLNGLVLGIADLQNENISEHETKLLGWLKKNLEDVSSEARKDLAAYHQS